MNVRKSICMTSQQRVLLPDQSLARLGMMPCRPYYHDYETGADPEGGARPPLFAPKVP